MKYQIFISSTYEDLKQEREVVIKSIMELNHIPAGMEQFPAMDEKQLEYIKRIIDISDYYVLIIAGRYGSTDSTGISYTEMEYDYAIKQGIPTLVFIHQEIDKIEFGKSEQDQEKRLKLESFKKKASANKLVKFWNDANDLALKINTSISQASILYPRVGWKRANLIANEFVMSDLIVKNKEVEELKDKIAKIEIQPKFEGLANLSDFFTFRISDNMGTSADLTYTWNRIFSIIASYIKSQSSLEEIRNKAAQDFLRITNTYNRVGLNTCKINNVHFDDIINQFECYNFITYESNEACLTDRGKEYYRYSRAIRTELES